jgi:hypothetical protein
MHRSAQLAEQVRVVPAQLFEHDRPALLVQLLSAQQQVGQPRFVAVHGRLDSRPRIAFTSTSDSR